MIDQGVDSISNFYCGNNFGIKMGKTCAVPRCTTGSKSSIRDNKKRKVKNKTLFKVPKDIVAFEKWKQACNNFQLSENNYICEKHFRESDLMRKFTHIINNGVIEEIEREVPLLQKGAVPCFFMNKKSKIITERMPVQPEPALMIRAPESDENTVEVKMENVVKWNFQTLSETYRTIKLPSDEWAAAANRRIGFIQFTSVQDKDIQRGLRIYNNMKMEILLDCRPLNLQRVHPPKSESDLVELLDMVAKLKVCRTTINKKRSPESRCYKFQK